MGGGSSPVAGHGLAWHRRRLGWHCPVPWHAGCRGDNVSLPCPCNPSGRTLLWTAGAACILKCPLDWQRWGMVESCLCLGLTTWELYLWWSTLALSLQGWVSPVICSLLFLGQQWKWGLEVRLTIWVVPWVSLPLGPCCLFQPQSETQVQSAFLCGDIQMHVLQAKADGPLVWQALARSRFPLDDVLLISSNLLRGATASSQPAKGADHFSQLPVGS